MCFISKAVEDNPRAHYAVHARASPYHARDGLRARHERGVPSRGASLRLVAYDTDPVHDVRHAIHDRGGRGPERVTQILLEAFDVPANTRYLCHIANRRNDDQ